MDTLASGMVMGGVALIVLSGIYSTIKAFEESPLWGFLSLFTGTLAYAIHCFRENKKPVFMLLLGIAFVILGTVLAEM